MLRSIVFLFFVTVLPLAAQAQFMGNGMGMGGMGMGRPGLNRTMAPPPTPMMPNIAAEMAYKDQKWMRDNLALSKDQEKAIKKIYKEYAPREQDALKDILGKDPSVRPSPEAVNQMRDIMVMYGEYKEDEIKLVLSPEQWTHYQRSKARIQKEIGGVRPPAPKTFPQFPADSVVVFKQ